MPSFSRTSRLGLAGLAACSVSLASARPLFADDKQACLDAYDKAQTLRQDDKLVAARDQLLVCARNVCPGILRKDCIEWLSEVQASMPTVVLAVKDSEGRDLVDVEVILDGEPFVSQIDGKAVPVDPGVHMFRFETDGFDPVDKKLVIHEGVRNRSIEIRFGEEDPQSDSAADGSAHGSVDVVDAGSSPTLAYVFGGIGLVGLGAFTYFGTQYDSKLDDMDACKPNCSQSDADDASSTRTMAFVSAGVGVVSLGVATYLFLSSPSKEQAATEVSSVPRVDLTPVQGGAVGSVGGRF